MLVSGGKEGHMAAKVVSFTDEEQESYLKPLRKAVKRLHEGKLSPEEALRALELAAILLEHGGLEYGQGREPAKSDIIKLVRLATGLSLSKKGKPALKVLIAGQAARSVNVTRGVTLNLTWDHRLASVAVSPKELELRNKALKFVGVAQDKANDVAQGHDRYLAGALSNV